MEINLKKYKEYLKEIKQLSDSTIETYIKRLNYYIKTGEIEEQNLFKNY